MASVKVFGSPTSAEVARVLMCLFEKEVEFQLIRVDAYRGTKRMPQYLKLQPQGEALTFEDESLTLSDSRGILRHISHKYAKQGNPYLIGTGALERASIEQWLQTEAQSFDAPSAEMVYSLAFLPPTLPKQNDNGNGGAFNARDATVGSNADASSGKRGVAGSQPAASQTKVSAQKEEEMLKLFEQRKKDLEKLLDIYEQRLEEATFLAGDNFTIADLSHLPYADHLVSDPRSRRMFESRKNVSRWWHDVSGRDTWKYVKTLQRPPSTSTDASAKNGQLGQQQHLPSSTDGHGVKTQRLVQNERHF
ncbi:glutathione transferase11 [Zea mays]|uniref:glutathione transferase n=1 Tax=Zea mays TaxID=4577 RepID=B4FV03_MAIZE|nr:glutathione transferase11 [Zea mays]ACF85946.1 unknown [Zea mays]ONL93398.1 glutathione transferase11 [Zea mays]|eukprot:NP_001104980.2 glutathione transferase11 [Zea mays]